MKSSAIFKTTILMAAMVGLFMAIGYGIGGQSGALLALVVAGALNFGMYWFSGSMVLKMQNAVPLDEQRFPQIRPMVQDIAAKDNLPMPQLYYVNTPIPNAFATGRNPSHAVVAVTAGIMELLSDDELYAVLAHELGHVKNYDMLVSTIAATVGGAISYLAQFALFFGGDRESPNPIALLAMAIFAPLAAMLIQLAVSRTREFGADAHSKHITGGDGHALASALQKLEQLKPQLRDYQPTTAEQSTAHLMFTNMFTTDGIGALFSTHPSTSARVKRLLQ